MTFSKSLAYTQIMSAQKKGFTLIELLIVIAILAILATVSLAIYSGVQKKGRIVKRTEDLKAIQTALELYNSANKSYPTTSGAWRSECSIWGGYTSDQVVKDVVNFNLLVPTYMPSFPADPSMDKANNTSCYIYASDGIDYKLVDRSISEFTQADYLSQRNLIDPNRDGGPDPCKVDVTTITAWSVWSSATSACW